MDAAKNAPKDYGVRSRAKGARVPLTVVIVVGAVLVAAYFGGSWLYHRPMAIERAQAWTISGPPCPELSRADFVQRGLKAPRVFDFEGLSLARQFGHVSCMIVANEGGKGLGDYPVCQFTSPTVLQVTTAKGELFFEPGPGHAATISAQHGKVSCVLASKFTLN
ncbi:MAG: hypothetical protein ABI655_03655 [Phenylobacterium sp.]